MIQRRFPIEIYSRNPLKIDVGCGDDQKRKKDGFIGIDINEEGQEILWDVEEGIPFADNSVDEIFCSHVMEHLDQPLDVFNEFHRVLKKDSKCHIIVPSVEFNKGAFVLTHKIFYNETTFQHLCRTDVSRDYGMKQWRLDSIVTNKRGDIHAFLYPIK